MGFFAGTEKVLAFTDYLGFAFVWRLDSTHERHGYSPIHLHAFLEERVACRRLFLEFLHSTMTAPPL